MKTGFVYFQPGSTSFPLEGKLRFSRPFRDRVHGWKFIAVLVQRSFLFDLFVGPICLSSTSGNFCLMIKGAVSQNSFAVSTNKAKR